MAENRLFPSSTPDNRLLAWWQQQQEQAAAVRQGLADQAAARYGQVVGQPSLSVDYVQNRLGALNDWGADQAQQMQGHLIDPRTRELTDNGQQYANMVGSFAGNALATVSQSALESLASRRALIYNPPKVSERPFSADYPSGAQADVTGRLLSDVEGRPLSAPYVAGRTMVGEGDKVISATALDAIAEGSTGAGIATVAPRALGKGVAGQLVKTRNPQTGSVEYSIQVANDLGASGMQAVAAHEVGHAIDQVAGGISTKGLDAELKPLYNTLNNSQTWGPSVTPQSAGYAGAEASREKIAEAIRGYMADPNWMKTVAPVTATRIRDAVNSHPLLSKVIQFNSAAGLGVIAAAQDSQS